MKNKSVAKPTGKLIRKVGQFLVKNWSAFQGGQKVGKMRADSEPFKAKQSVLKVDKNRTENLRQLFVKTTPIRVHRRFTKTSPGFEGLSLGRCQKSDQKASLVFYLSFVLLPHVGEYIRKSPIQFDIPSSYLYGVVLKKLCL